MASGPSAVSARSYRNSLGGSARVCSRYLADAALVSTAAHRPFPSTGRKEGRRGKEGKEGGGGRRTETGHSEFSFLARFPSLLLLGLLSFRLLSI